MAIYTKTSNGWEAIAQDVKAVSSFGSIVPDGNQTDEGTYTDSSGREWVWYEWTDPDKASSFTTDGGLLWCLVVGGGDGGWNTSNNSNKNGQPGNVREGFWEFDAGVRLVHVGDKGATNSNPKGEPSYIDDVLTGFSVQTDTDWGETSQGRGIGKDGYKSLITGDEREYSPAYDRPLRPGRGGYEGGEQQPGCVIVATVVNGGKPKPVQPALTPATIVSAPVKVSGSADPVEWFVKQTDGTRKKITVLPGNTAGGDENTFEVTMTPGVLPGIMVGSGGPGGYTNNGVWSSVGAGGAGGVIGIGANVPVILPRQEETTYTIKVGSTSTFTNENDIYLYGQNTTIAVQGQEPFIAALGGGSGICYRGSQYIQPHQGASGGGGSIGSAEGSINPYWSAGKGTPGQGHDGGMAVYNWGGAGGGYSSPGEGTGNPYSPGAKSGGSGFNLKDSLGLDGNDAATVAFLDAVTAGGWIAGGGGNLGATPIHGGGAGTNGNAQDFTGGGGGAGSGYGGTGGCGMVLLIEDTES